MIMTGIPEEGLHVERQFQHGNFSLTHHRRHNDSSGLTTTTLTAPLGPGGNLPDGEAMTMEEMTNTGDLPPLKIIPPNRRGANEASSSKVTVRLKLMHGPVVNRPLHQIPGLSAVSPDETTYKCGNLQHRFNHRRQLLTNGGWVKISGWYFPTNNFFSSLQIKIQSFARIYPHREAIGCSLGLDMDFIFVNLCHYKLSW